MCGTGALKRTNGEKRGQNTEIKPIKNETNSAINDLVGNSIHFVCYSAENCKLLKIPKFNAKITKREKVQKKRYKMKCQFNLAFAVSTVSMQRFHNSNSLFHSVECCLHFKLGSASRHFQLKSELNAKNDC